MAGIHGMFLGMAGGLRKVSLVISTNTQNYNIKTAALAAGWDGVSPREIALTINPGVYVGSSSNASPAIDTGTSFLASCRISLVNRGYILGRGGNANGGSAGPALLAQVPITIDNSSGVIGGGGGGGGYGAYYRAEWTVNKATFYTYGGGGGGGGGAGYSPGSGGGVNGSSSGVNPGAVQPSGGGSGGLTSPGGGGSGGYGLGHYNWYAAGGSGGSGGSLGAAGSSGSGGGSGGSLLNGTNLSGPGPGGAGGACTSGNANITWVNTGTRLGALG